MAKITVELVKYDMDKTKKRKRANFIVGDKTEEAIIDKLERIHKGEKVEAIHEVVWGEEEEIKEQPERKKVEKEPGEKVTGVVKFFDHEKGFGFIKPDVNMDDLFFHATALDGKDIYDEDAVEFEVGEGPKGKIAVKIKYIE